MGLGASVLPKEEEQQTACTTTAGGKKKTHLKKKDRKSQTEEWKKVVETFISQTLDPSYINFPVRASTVEAASLYPASEQDKQQSCLMPGTHKHLGGAYDPTDGCIYGVPANSRSVLCLQYDKDTNTYQMKTIPLPDSIVDCRFKWLRGIFAHGYMWAIPSWAHSVLCVDVDAYWGRRPAKGDIVQLLPLPEEHPKGLQWQWHGAGINQEKTAIFCIPSNAKMVLKVDLIDKTTSLIPITYDPERYPNFDINKTNKWYGGIPGNDNCVYGVPYRSCAVLRIDCTANTAELIGPDYGTAKFYWHGGIQVNGKIYAHPSHASTVLVINTAPGLDKHDRCSELPIEKAEYDTDSRENYKWLGGSVGADNNIYCPACDTSAVLKIETQTDKCTTFGFAGSLKNKWQGGIRGRDGCIYCIPASGVHVLRIATANGENAVQLLGDLPVHKDKWQGGHEGLDGSLYFIPENGYRVLKVTPPDQPPVIIDGKLPEGDVKIEML